MQHACVGAVNSRLREGDLVRYFIGEVCPLCLHVGTTSDAWIPAVVWKVSSTHIWIRYQYISYRGWYYRRTKRHRYWVKCFPRNTRLIRPESNFPDHFLFSSKLSHETRAKIILHSGSCPLRKWRKQFFRRLHRNIISQTEERWRKPLHVFGSKENDEEDEDSFWELEGEGFYYLKEADGQPPRWECYFGEGAGDDDQDEHEEEGEEDTDEEDRIEANEEHKEQKENNEMSSVIRGKKSLPSKRWERKGKANRRGRKMVG